MANLELSGDRCFGKFEGNVYADYRGEGNYDCGWKGKGLIRKSDERTVRFLFHSSLGRFYEPRLSRFDDIDELQKLIISIIPDIPKTRIFDMGCLIDSALAPIYESALRQEEDDEVIIPHIVFPNYLKLQELINSGIFLEEVGQATLALHS